jgi:hypothetical protein
MAMDGDKAADEGLSGARTRRAPAENAPAGAASDANPHGRAAGRIDLAAAVAELAGAIDQADGDQADLLDGSPDLGDLDVLAQAAETSAAGRRARGRPKGSANKRNDRVFDYLEALGHRNPAVTLSLIQSADLVELAKAIGANTPKGRLALLQIQRQAAADLMPYNFAKKPQKIEAEVTRTHLFLAGQIGTGAPGGGGMSLFGSSKEINGLAVRQTEGESHGSEKPSDINDMGGESD